ncbi:MAG: hypothetical protein HQ559_12700 [Lentisphaerae bacterium]|nr:hypothetical protein [Lentisphaerota bacterium]
MSSTSKKALATMLLLVTAGVVCHARVFWRRPGRSHARRAIETLGGQLAYATDVTVNGGEGKLAVFHFDDAIDRVVPGLASAFDLPRTRPVARSMWRASFPSRDTTITLMAIDLPDADRVIVFAFERTGTGAATPRKSPAALPAFPGAEPLFSSRDHRAGMDLGVSRTAVTPAAVQEFYASQLPADGWSAALPARSRTAANRRSLEMYLRGDEICCVQALGDENGATTISLLYKSRGVK